MRCMSRLLPAMSVLPNCAGAADPIPDKVKGVCAANFFRSWYSRANVCAHRERHGKSENSFSLIKV